LVRNASETIRAPVSAGITRSSNPPNWTRRNGSANTSSTASTPIR
jgi:hypothetical protein